VFAVLWVDWLYLVLRLLGWLGVCFCLVAGGVIVLCRRYRFSGLAGLVGLVGFVICGVVLLFCGFMVDVGLICWFSMVVACLGVCT